MIDYFFIVFAAVVGVRYFFLSNNKRTYDVWIKKGGEKYAARNRKIFFVLSLLVLIAAGLWLGFDLFLFYKEFQNPK
jgi:isoprenylcysteine carboxyl methyltransferase (ICMT) family protein YpbQ